MLKLFAELILNQVFSQKKLKWPAVVVKKLASVHISKTSILCCSMFSWEFFNFFCKNKFVKSVAR